ncbi:MAG: hypothetical protein BWY83_01899 [bacterium ADurb.Bin478]|nr:MAG: hypothetical protein BWY83_01899 [bacterium ADurb.Bin478]
MERWFGRSSAARRGSVRPSSMRMVAGANDQNLRQSVHVLLRPAVSHRHHSECARVGDQHGRWRLSSGERSNPHLSNPGSQQGAGGCARRHSDRHPAGGFFHHSKVCRRNPGADRGPLHPFLAVQQAAVGRTAASVPQWAGSESAGPVAFAPLDRPIFRCAVHRL